MSHLPHVISYAAIYSWLGRYCDNNRGHSARDLWVCKDSFRLTKHAPENALELTNLPLAAP
jgi:hypothetical protein